MRRSGNKPPPLQGQAPLLACGATIDFLTRCQARLRQTDSDLFILTHRACDYVRLIGVLARENSSFIAAHVREQHGVVEDKRWDKSSYV